MSTPDLTDSEPYELVPLNDYIYGNAHHDGLLGYVSGNGNASEPMAKVTPESAKRIRARIAELFPKFGGKPIDPKVLRTLGPGYVVS